MAAGNTLYGTTYGGGSGENTNGPIFALNTDGMGFASYHNFSPLGFPYPTNSDGAYPEAGMISSGGTLYGTTSMGGLSGGGYGTIFAINTNGIGFNTVLDFNFFKGSTPYSELLLINNLLYGTTAAGGANEAGTVFSATTNGSVLSDLYDFPLPTYSGGAGTNSAGAEPWSGLVFADGTLFGVTPAGGAGGVGTVYGLILPSSAPVPILLNAQVTGGALVLSWSDATFSLQFAASLNGSFHVVPGATSPYTVPTTNLVQFFRLQAN